jgi:hypothetical protein
MAACVMVLPGTAGVNLDDMDEHVVLPHQPVQLCMAITSEMLAPDMCISRKEKGKEAPAPVQIDTLKLSRRPSRLRKENASRAYVQGAKLR